MDPNETLGRIRELVDQLLYPEQPDTDMRVIEVRADRLAEHFRALDEWLVRGGFLPAAWNATTRENVGLELVEPLGPPNPAHAELPEHDDAQPERPIVGSHSWQERKAPGYGQEPDPVTGRGFVELSDGTTSIAGSPAHLADQQTAPGHYAELPEHHQ